MNKINCGEIVVIDHFDFKYLVLEILENNLLKAVPVLNISSLEVDFSKTQMFEFNQIQDKIKKLASEEFLLILRKYVKYTSTLYLKNKKTEIKEFIPASGKNIGLEELHNMIDASLDMWLTEERFAKDFEESFCKFLNVSHSLCVNSGSSANLIAITALTSHKFGDKRIKEGDEVITVAAGFPTTISPIIQNKLVPVFVDIEKDTYNIDCTQVEESITQKTKAIFVAHTLGNPFDIEKILSICKKYDLYLIEDNCDSLGSKYNEKYTGTFGHIGTFSFYPAHHITMGEGGAVVTNNKELYKIMYSLRSWGRDCWCKPGSDDTCKRRFKDQYGLLPIGYDHKFVFSELGYNFKITDWQASIGLAQLKKLNKFTEKRHENFNYLVNKLRKFEKYLSFPVTLDNSIPSWFGLILSVKQNIDKVKLVNFLETQGVGTRPLFAGNMLRHPAFIDNNFKIKIRSSSLINSKELNSNHFDLLPNSDFVMNNSFWIGIWPGIGKKEMDSICIVLEKFFKENRI